MGLNSTEFILVATLVCLVHSNALRRKGKICESVTTRHLVTQVMLVYGIKNTNQWLPISHI